MPPKAEPEETGGLHINKTGEAPGPRHICLQKYRARGVVSMGTCMLMPTILVLSRALVTPTVVYLLKIKQGDMQPAAGPLWRWYCTSWFVVRKQGSKQVALSQCYACLAHLTAVLLGAAGGPSTAGLDTTSL